MVWFGRGLGGGRERRVTFDRPPINTITATTVAELIGLVEQEPALQVVVFDSANPALYLAHYDVDNDPGRTAALGLGPTPTISNAPRAEQCDT